LGLDDFVTEALLAIDTRPRFTPHGEGAILILRGVNLNEGSEPEDMVSIRFWIEESLVVGIWIRRSFAVRDVVDAIKRGNAPCNAAELISRITFRLVDRAEPVISKMSEEMDTLEERGDSEAYAVIQKELVHIRQTTSALRRFLAPQRDALTTFAIEDFNWLDEREQSRLREAAERITRLGEELDMLRERAMIAHDQILAERSDRMNRTMLILAILSAIFLPLGFLTGILGINVGGLPGADNPYAFWIVCAISTLVGLVLWLIVRNSRLMD